MDLAIECKSNRELRSVDLKGLRGLKYEERPRRSIVVCREQCARTTEDGIEILPWQQFCRMWWGGELD